MPLTFQVTPVGTIHKTEAKTWIEIEAPYLPAMDGLEGFSHIHVFFWFHENDTIEGRQMLKVHPRKDKDNPLTGIFATHSPLRPNLIGMTLCRVVAFDPPRSSLIESMPLTALPCWISNVISPAPGRLKIFACPGGSKRAPLSWSNLRVRSSK